jgi:hypothetical protein
MDISHLTLYVNILIAIAAYVALYQIKVSKDIAEQNAYRESVRFGVDLTRRYLDEYIKASSESFDYREENKIEIVKIPAVLQHFTEEEMLEKIDKQIIRQAYEQHTDIFNNHKELWKLHLYEMNCLESIATPIIAGVANGDSAFTAIGKSFCHSVNFFWFEYSYFRTDDKKEYDSYANTISLYGIWRKKLDKLDLAQSKRNIEKKLEELNNA